MVQIICGRDSSTGPIYDLGANKHVVDTYVLVEEEEEESLRMTECIWVVHEIYTYIHIIYIYVCMYVNYRSIGQRERSRAEQGTIKPQPHRAQHHLSFFSFLPSSAPLHSTRRTYVHTHTHTHTHIYSGRHLNETQHLYISHYSSSSAF